MSISKETMPSLFSFSLLLVSGCLIAVMLPLARVVTDAGLSPIVYAFWQSLGAGLLLLGFGWKRLKFRINYRFLRYCIISGLTGVALPNALAFWIVGEIGPGFTATLYAFPPIFTLVFSLFMRIERPNCRRVAGVGLACAGCFWIVLSQMDVVPSSTFGWYLLGLLVPLSLGLGNVYRSVAWPPGLDPVALAAGMMLGASILLLCALSLDSGADLLPTLERSKTYSLVVLQMLLTALTYLSFFELQKRSSPLFLSQMGCIAALVGLLIGMSFFGEQYALGVWLGVLVVLLGLWMNNSVKPDPLTSD